MANPYFDIVNTIDIKRFSSTLLNQYGAQKRVLNSDGTYATTYKYSKGDESFFAPDALALSDTTLVRGFLSEDVFTAGAGYFQSRGASLANAATMGALIIDTARMLEVSPISLLETLPSGKTSIELAAYGSLNALRSVSDQHESVSTINNSKSIKWKNK